MKLAESSRFLYDVKITQMTSATTTQRELWREFGSKRAWTPQSSFPVRRLRLTEPMLKEARKSFYVEGDWFRVNATAITLPREIERTGNERCKFAINLS